MVLGRRRSKNLDALTGDAAENASAALSSQLRSLKSKASIQSGGIAVVDAEVQVGIRADILFELLADPGKHETIFDAIEGATFRLVAEKGPWRKYELDYKARWKFWKVTGVCDNKCYMETHADHGTVSFKLREPGFLKMYEGTWVVRPEGQKSLQMYSRNQPAAVLSKQAPSSQSSGELMPPALLQRSSSPPPPWSGLFQAMANVTSAFSNPTQAPQDNRLPWGTLASINMPIVTLQGLSVTRGSAASSPAASPPASPRAGATADVSTSDRPTPYPNSSIVQIVNLRMCPKVGPPYPLGGLLKGHAQGQVEEMIRGLVSVASKLEASGVSSLTAKQRSHSSNQSTTSSRIPTAHESTPDIPDAPLSTQSASMASLYSASNSGSLVESVSGGRRANTWHAPNPMQQWKHASLQSFKVPVGESLEEEDDE